jgi:UDP-2,3-diacylglucosamine hydrolase
MTELPQKNSKNNTYFISDLHLDPSRPQLFKLFDEFIEKIRHDVEALYILGDLFEFWIGDDIIDLPIGKPFLPVIDQLRSLSDAGVKIFFIQGNRDFLIGEAFMKRIGGELLPDETVVDLYGTPALIMHGDTLCTDDKGYQWLRRILRMKIVQKLYLSMSPEKRSAKANQVRQRTQRSTQNKSYEILDVNQQEVEKVAKRWGVSLLIHGHTHRPAEHEFMFEGKPVKRIVLGDWRDKACYLYFAKEGFESCY